jgi:hypothetical protein
MMTVHHRKPKSLGCKREPNNVRILPFLKKRKAWHMLFINFTPERIAEAINKKYFDPDYEFVVRRKA